MDFRIARGPPLVEGHQYPHPAATREDGIKKRSRTLDQVKGYQDMGLADYDAGKLAAAQQLPVLSSMVRGEEMYQGKSSGALDFNRDLTGVDYASKGLLTFGDTAGTGAFGASNGLVPTRLGGSAPPTFQPLFSPESENVKLWRVVDSKEAALIREGKWVASSDPHLQEVKLAWSSEEIAKNWRAGGYYRDAQRAGLQVVDFDAPKNAVTQGHFERYGVNEYCQRVSIGALNKQTASQQAAAAAAAAAVAASAAADAKKEEPK